MLGWIQGSKRWLRKVNTKNWVNVDKSRLICKFQESHIKEGYLTSSMLRKYKKLVKMEGGRLNCVDK